MVYNYASALASLSPYLFLSDTLTLSYPLVDVLPNSQTNIRMQGSMSTETGISFKTGVFIFTCKVSIMSVLKKIHLKPMSTFFFIHLSYMEFIIHGIYDLLSIDVAAVLQKCFSNVKQWNKDDIKNSM